MPKQNYALEQGGPKRLEISWGSFFKNGVVKLDGQVIGTMADQKAMMAGPTFPLPDGSLLKVQLVSNLAGSEMQVTRNGEPLPGSASNPETRVKTAAIIIYFVAGLNMLLGLIAMFAESDFLYALGISWFNLLFGFFFLVMGLLVQLKKSKVALVLAIVIFALDALSGLVLTVMAGESPSIWGLLMRVLLIIPMVQAVKSITELKKKEAANPPTFIPPA